MGAATGGLRRGTVSLEITGAPVRMTGTVTLEAQPDGGTRQSYVGELKATVPLFAAAVEDAAAGPSGRRSRPRSRPAWSGSRPLRHLGPPSSAPGEPSAQTLPTGRESITIQAQRLSRKRPDLQ
ncbi:DUF2505 family protein [Oerskovia sp. M15]